MTCARVPDASSSSSRFFCAASPPSSPGHTSLVNAMCVPVGDQTWLSAPLEMLVTALASPPSIAMRQTCCEPLRLELNAIQRESFDQRGWLSPFSCVVSWRGSPPAEGTIQMCDVDEPFSREGVLTA